MDSRRYAAYLRTLDLLYRPDAGTLSPEQRELVRDHAEELLLHRGPRLTDEVDETAHSAMFLLRHLAAVGLLPGGLAAELRRTVLACAGSTARDHEHATADPRGLSPGSAPRP